MKLATHSNLTCSFQMSLIGSTSTAMNNIPKESKIARIRYLFIL
jgi:hypothetical protein